METLPTVWLLVAMGALIIGVDITLFRNHFVARLLANVGIVLIFSALYLSLRGGA